MNELHYIENEEKSIIIMNDDCDYEEFIELMRDIMNLKILIKEDFSIIDMNYYNELVTEVKTTLLNLTRNLLPE